MNKFPYAFRFHIRPDEPLSIVPLSGKITELTTAGQLFEQIFFTGQSGPDGMSLLLALEADEEAYALIQCCGLISVVMADLKPEPGWLLRVEQVFLEQDDVPPFLLK